MPHRSHLPLAVIYQDEAALSVLPLERLTEMLRECDRWFANVAAFEAAIETQSGRTVFNALARQDIADATAARVRLQDAIDRNHDELRLQLGLNGPTDDWRSSVP